MELTKDNGYIFFESHGLSSDGIQFMDVCSIFEQFGMKIVYSAYSGEDGDRRVVVLQR